MIVKKKKKKQLYILCKILNHHGITVLDDVLQKINSFGKESILHLISWRCIEFFYIQLTIDSYFIPWQ